MENKMGEAIQGFTLSETLTKNKKIPNLFHYPK